jgi:hypothetical protein
MVRGNAGAVVVVGCVSKQTPQDSGTEQNMSVKRAPVVRATGMAPNEVTESVHGVLVYEDFVTGLRARSVFEQCAAHFGAGNRTRVSLWRFDMLELAPLRQQAAREAAGAELVVLSAHGDAELPAGLRSWFLEWLGTIPGQPWALIVSLDRGAGTRESAGRLLGFLGPLAQRANMDFFFYSTQALSVRSELESMRAGHRSLRGSDGPCEALVEHDPPPHWGINE